MHGLLTTRKDSILIELSDGASMKIAHSDRVLREGNELEVSFKLVVMEVAGELRLVPISEFCEDHGKTLTLKIL